MSATPSPRDLSDTRPPAAVPGSAISAPAVSRPCPICRTSQDSRLFAEANFDLTRLNDFAFASRKLPENMHLSLHECRLCDTLYASPVFETGVLAAAYRGAAYDSGVAARCAALTYAQILEGVAGLLPTRNGALDVGAGDGAFLAELLKQGFSNVAGVEPSLAAVATAPAEVKSLIHTGMFSADDFAPGSLSLVTCFQTIEHLDDPLMFCQEAGRLLRPGGALFLIGHNRRSLSALVLGRKSPIFDIEHFQLFSPKSLAALLHAAGFHEVRISTVVNRYPLSYWARLFPMPGSVKSRFIRLLERCGLANLNFSLPAGNIAAVGFKP